jgi:hypothetical protein
VGEINCWFLVHFPLVPTLRTNVPTIVADSSPVVVLCTCWRVAPSCCCALPLLALMSMEEVIVRGQTNHFAIPQSLSTRSLSLYILVLYTRTKTTPTPFCFGVVSPFRTTPRCLLKIIACIAHAWIVEGRLYDARLCVDCTFVSRTAIVENRLKDKKQRTPRTHAFLGRRSRRLGSRVSFGFES